MGSPGWEFILMRSPGWEFIFMRSPGWEFIFMRSPGWEFIFMRSSGWELMFHTFMRRPMVGNSKITHVHHAHLILRAPLEVHTYILEFWVRPCTRS